MKHLSSGSISRWLHYRLGALALLLATAGAAHAQTPTATFAPVATYNAGSYPLGIAVADVNGDGKPDLLTANFFDSTVGVLLGNGNGTFAPVVTYSTGSHSQPAGIAVADVNGDGKPDLLTANANTGTAGVLLGNGNGTFQPAATYATGSNSYPLGIAVADVNGDGKPDLVTANDGSSTAGVLLGNGNGTFAPVVTYATGSGSSRAEVIAVADVNGDGKPDLLTANLYGYTAGVLLGNGNGTFQPAVTYASGGRPFGIAVADVNGDGKPDLLTANADFNTAGVLLGNGNGTFQPAATYATGTGSFPVRITVADVNGDGKPDLVTANQSSNTAGVLLGNGNGTFQPAATYATGTGSDNYPYDIAVADVNGDGKPDLIPANYHSSTAGVLLNTTVYAAPTLTKLNPTSALVGRSVTLTGTNLSSATGVRFNGTAATTFAVVNGTTVTATVPPGATSGPVTVTTPGGTSNGVVLTITTAPTVTTAAASSITTTSAVLSGNVTADNNAAVTNRGVVYSSTNPAPTIGGAGVTQDANGSGMGSYSKAIADLTPGTTYTVRAYATNSVGTSYGSAVTFTTAVYSSVVSINRADSNPTNASSVRYTVTFSAPITGLSASNFSLVTTGVTGAAPASVSGSGTTYTVTVYTGTGTGTLLLYLNNGFGVPNLTGPFPFYGQPYTIDKTTPTVTLTSPTVATGGSTSASPVTFTAQFSESVGSSFTASDIAVSGGTVSSFVANNSPANSYTFTVTPVGGPVTVSIAAGVTQDAAGNDNVAAAPYSFTFTPAPVAGTISVLYQTGDLGQPTDNQLRPFLQLVNAGTAAVPYQSLTVRYWLTVENFAGQLVTPIDYAKLGTSFVSTRYVMLPTPRQGAYGYIEYAFAAGAGSLAPGTDSGPIYGKAYKQNYTSFDETDDWSYRASSSFAPNDHITVYQDGTLVSGTEPPVVAASPSLKVYASNQDTSPSTSYISVALQVGNAGNVPVNFADLKVRYWFTPDGPQPLVYQVDYAVLGASNFSLQTGQKGTQTYAELSFASGLGTFYPMGNTGNIQFKIRKDNYGALTQTNDYSFGGSSALVEQPRITAYLNGQLVFGTEPTSAATAAVRSGEPVAAAGGPALTMQLTGSPNPVTDQLRLQFALPYTQAYTLAVYDGLGRLVQQLASSEAAAGQAQQVEVPTQAYAAGLYVVRLTTATGTQHLKFVKH